MIEAKTVRKFYEGYPERWIQGHSWMDKHGNTANNVEDVDCGCLIGIIFLVYKPQISAAYNSVGKYAALAAEIIEAEDAADREAIDKVMAVINKHYPGYASIVRWNDAKERTFEEVIRVVIEAGV